MDNSKQKVVLRDFDVEEIKVRLRLDIPKIERHVEALEEEARGNWKVFDLEVTI